MKRILASILAGTVLMVSSCSKHLDINDNPNNATAATPELVLPQAMTGTANSLNAFNTYGSQIAGFSANAGGFGGFGANITYNFTTEYSNLWTSVFDNLNDYQYILNSTDDQRTLYGYFNAAARIMKAYNYQLLVDAYNAVPYSEALKGADNLAPAYDQPEVIYASLASELDLAIQTIKDAEATTETVTPMGAADVVFNGDMELWKQFANTVKLRLIIRAGDKVNFANTDFDEAGFLAEDALVNPGYARDNNRQNPLWNNWAFTATGTAGNKAWMPNIYVYSFYDGTKLLDKGRGAAIYLNYPNTGTNRLGVESNSIESSPTGSFWYSNPDRTAGTAGNSVGVLKGPDAGMPILMASESKFLQAEAALKGLIDGDVATLFEEGITASYNYTYMLPDGSIDGDVDADVATYFADNSTSYLVDFSKATTDARKLEAIITQKYIALNFTNSHEAWNEYRRTHYPVTVAGGSGVQTFASSVSESPRPDKLPTRILYPTSEGSYNSANVPTGITPGNSLIFWAQ